MRQLRDIVLKLDNEYGKLSPLNNISNLEMILRRCQGNKADLLWFFQHLSFVLEAAILGPRDVTVRALDQPRSAGSSGLVALFLAKKKILAHFLESVLADVPPRIASSLRMTWPAMMLGRKRLELERLLWTSHGKVPSLSPKGRS